MKSQLPELSQLLEHGVLTSEARTPLLVASTIRNPFDALVSHFVKVQDRYTRDPDRRPASTKASREFESWLRFRFHPGLSWRIRGRKPEEAVRWTVGSDMVMRFERLQADFDVLMRRVGVQEPIEIAARNVTEQRARRPYQEFYTPGSRSLVEEVFAKDLAEFGYRFEPVPA